MSTVKTSNLQNASASNPNIVLNSDGTIGGDCLTQTCRAWVNFNGTGSVAIRGQYNVSSITDNGTGDYTVNFTTALPDANYAAIVGLEPGATQLISLVGSSGGGVPTAPNASSIRIESVARGTGSNTDTAGFYVAIFR